MIPTRASSRVLLLLTILLLAASYAWRAAPPVRAADDDTTAAEAALAFADAATTASAGAKKAEAAQPADAGQPAAAPTAAPTPVPTPPMRANGARPGATPAATPAPAKALAPTPAAAAGTVGVAGVDTIKRNAEGEPVADMVFVKPQLLSVVLDELSSQTGVKIDTLGKMPDKVACSGEGLTVRTVLDQIASANKLYVVKNPDGSYVMMDEPAYKDYQIKLVDQKIYQPQHIDAKYFYDAVQKANILTKGVGSIQLDPRTGKVIIVDLPEVLARAQDMLDLLDEAIYTRVFYIKYADMKTVVDKIKQYKSDPGSIDEDDKNHIIIVQDLLANIQRMESMIDLLDTRQMRRVYNINSIDVDGKDLDALKQNLDNLVTKDAYYYIDEKRGLLILEDTPEKQEDVLKFLKVFSRTVDQVQIQAELLDVDQNVNLQYGTQASYSTLFKDSVMSITNAGGSSSAGTGTGTGTGGTGSGSTAAVLNYAVPIGTNGQLHATLSALLTDADTRVLMRPRLLVKNGETANIVSGTDLPIVTTTSTGETTGVNNSPYLTTEQQYISAGLSIDITPKVSPTGIVEIKLNIDNSSATPTSVLSNGTANTAYSKTKATVKTILIVPDGETRAISGLVTQQQNDNVSGIPVLVKIPWIGPLLFGSKTKARDQHDLVFFITPTIVREEGQGSLIAYDFSKDQRPDFLGKTGMTEEDENETYGSKPAKRPGEHGAEPMPGATLLRNGAWLTSPTTATRRYEAPLPGLPLAGAAETSATKGAAGGAAETSGTKSVAGGGLLAPAGENSEAAMDAALAAGGGQAPAAHSLRPILGPGVTESATPKAGSSPSGTTTGETAAGAAGAKPTPTPTTPGAKPTPAGAKPTVTPTPSGTGTTQPVPAVPTPSPRPLPTPRVVPMPVQ